MRTTTGDVAKSINTKAVALTNNPIVKQVDLEDIDHPININQYSQKQNGSVVTVWLTAGDFALAMAQGTDPSASWKVMGDTNASPVTEIQPV